MQNSTGRMLHQISQLIKICCLLCAPIISAQAQSPSKINETNAYKRLDELQQTVIQLQHELQLLKQQQTLSASPKAISLGLQHIEHQFAVPVDYQHPSYGRFGTHYVTYDDGWVIRPYNRSRSPFELRINLHNQFRYTGFAREEDLFIDNAGNEITIDNRNDFDINRGRLVFSGYVFDPRFQFYTNIDYNTVAENQIQLLMSWFAYEFSDAFKFHWGLSKVPGTWEWLETSRYTLSAERTMATTFFRPSMTAGLWASGELQQDLYYRIMVGDGFNTFSLRAAELDTNLAYSGSVWWEPYGPFGPGFADLEYHDSLAVRLGHGLTYTRIDGEPTGAPGPEQTVVRLSDGTRLVETGALAPGVSVNCFDLTLYAVHLGLKYRGWNLSTEYFFRWLTSIEADGAIPDNSLFDHGYFVQGGVFAVPERLELFAIGSQVIGEFGTGNQVSAGFNWYFKGKRGSRFTIDATYLDESPAQQSRTGYVAGGTGTLIRAQLWSFF